MNQQNSRILERKSLLRVLEQLWTCNESPNTTT